MLRCLQSSSEDEEKALRLLFSKLNFGAISVKRFRPEMECSEEEEEEEDEVEDEEEEQQQQQQVMLAIPKQQKPRDFLI
jgi:hypothetical protein